MLSDLCGSMIIIISSRRKESTFSWLIRKLTLMRGASR
jgi:hypothetical protein